MLDIKILFKIKYYFIYLKCTLYFEKIKIVM